MDASVDGALSVVVFSSIARQSVDFYVASVLDATIPAGHFQGFV
jgi:hypothetical protein